MKVKSLIRLIKTRLRLLPVTQGYQGKDVALATLHGKERVIAPVFRRQLGARVVIAAVDTDSLGTFSGEIERTASPGQVVLAKARMGMTALGVPRGIATEGSFGPHPAIPFLVIHHELVAFIDEEAGVEIVEQQFFHRSIYDSIEVRSILEAQEFLKKNRFGRYGVIVQARDRDACPAIKGIRSMDELDVAVQQIKIVTGCSSVRLLTDMRAHMNPLRMWRIRGLAQALARRLGECCPACAAPGWGQTGREGGLRCRDCGARTEATQALIYSCSACSFKQRVPRPDGKRFASARECPLCNP